jgi:hypothetical protein
MHARRGARDAVLRLWQVTYCGTCATADSAKAPATGRCPLMRVIDVPSDLEGRVPLSPPDPVDMLVDTRRERLGVGRRSQLSLDQRFG